MIDLKKIVDYVYHFGLIYGISSSDLYNALQEFTKIPDDDLKQMATFNVDISVYKDGYKITRVNSILKKYQKELLNAYNQIPPKNRGKLDFKFDERKLPTYENFKVFEKRYDLKPVIKYSDANVEENNESE